MSGNDLFESLSSLRAYLEELVETGVDSLPLDRPVKYEEVVLHSPGQMVAEEAPAVYPAATAEASDAAEQETLESIRLELEGCGRCPLGASRTNLVFGVGNPGAALVFVGEAPGRDEDLQGEPFVGKAGGLLTSMINRMGFSRDEIYICNVLKCRPPNNRNPLPSEIEVCHPYLLRQIRSISPKAIIALGTFAAQTLLGTKEPISKLRGRFLDYHGIPLMPTFHPSFLLRNGPDMRWVVWEDMVKVLNLLGLPVPDVRKRQ
jgi:DNA polymerase